MKFIYLHLQLAERALFGSLGALERARYNRCKISKTTREKQSFERRANFDRYFQQI